MFSVYHSFLCGRFILMRMTSLMINAMPMKMVIVFIKD